MSNGFGPLSPVDWINHDDRHYLLQFEWSTGESYITVKGLDADRAAGAWLGAGEIDEEHGYICLPTGAATKIAAAILLSEADTVIDDADDRAVVVKLLHGILDGAHTDDTIDAT